MEGRSSAVATSPAAAASLRCRPNRMIAAANLFHYPPAAALAARLFAISKAPDIPVTSGFFPLATRTRAPGMCVGIYVCAEKETERGTESQFSPLSNCCCV